MSKPAKFIHNLSEETKILLSMNRLELALTDKTNAQLDFYLEDSSCEEIRIDIEEMVFKEKCSTDSGVLKQKIQEVLDEY